MGSPAIASEGCDVKLSSATESTTTLCVRQNTVCSPEHLFTVYSSSQSVCFQTDRFWRPACPCLSERHCEVRKMNAGNRNSAARLIGTALITALSLTAHAVAQKAGSPEQSRIKRVVVVSIP